MENTIPKPKYENIMGIKVEKKESKYTGDIYIQHSEANDASLIEVIAIGEDVTDVAVGDKVFVPLSAIRLPYNGISYALCHQRQIYATL